MTKTCFKRNISPSTCDYVLAGFSLLTKHNNLYTVKHVKVKLLGLKQNSNLASIIADIFIIEIRRFLKLTILLNTEFR